ncbi:hypothetical protein [Saccharothrix hoggarensis]|uniref:Subtilisin inhibitor-like n=1 Tax=Saccharothrix hoggarensis TaxID=913853 RepID=A0ABW3QRR4_9PSEU
MRKILWGVFALAVVALFVAAVVSIADDLTAPDDAVDASEVGNCVGFPGDDQGFEDADAARIVPCDDPDARFRVLADGEVQPGRDDPCGRHRDTAKVLVVGPMAPMAGRYLCLDRISRG